MTVPLRRAVLASLITFGVGLPLHADLLSYVAKPDPAYKWEKRSEKQQGVFGTITDLRLVSQVWQGIAWEHRVQVFRPKQLKTPDACGLLITGGNGGPETDALGMSLATQMGCTFAVLFNIPNQPLFGDLHEDALIAYTFQKWLETGDDTWPLLFPMTKSAVRAMDALQAFATEQWQQPLRRFVVTGASKRGWTTWLTGAADPARVVAIMPMVYDNLNLAKQMPHQLEVWGKYSVQIDDYTKLGIQDKLNSEQGRRLGAMVDPYTFLDRLTMPKLIINGSNDPYWAQDALNIYWDDLKGEKRILYVPNGAHGLGDLQRVANAATAFTRAVIGGQTPPQLTWKHDDDGGNARLTVHATPAATKACIWATLAPIQDFRDCKWESVPMTQAGGEARVGETFVGEIVRPKTGYMALFGEVTFTQDNRSFTFSTQVRVVKPEAK
jgi:PhoPQ-activated pathogenicity-related protein